MSWYDTSNNKENVVLIIVSLLLLLLLYYYVKALEWFVSTAKEVKFFFLAVNTNSVVQ